MNIQPVKYILFFIIQFFVLNDVYSQNSVSNSLADCEVLLSSEYISSGQEYFANLDKNNKATFHVTFFAGNKYRIVGCTSIQNHKLIIEVFDTDKNLLFSNKNHDYIQYWNLVFTSTVECIIELKIDADRHIKKPVKLLIGFNEESKYLDGSQ